MTSASTREFVSAKSGSVQASEAFTLPRRDTKEGKDPCVL